MHLEIFDVEHGACALLTADNRARMMIDCGHNASTGWRPGTWLKQSGISQLEMLTVTNYDEDHVSGFGNLLDNVHVQWIKRNATVNAATIRRLKSEDGMGPGIERLVDALENRFTQFAGPNNPLPTFAGLEVREFYNSYPTFEDENNLSLLTLLKCNGTGVLFTGDLERAGWLKLLEREDVRQALRETSVFIAPHHGRESGCCDEIFEFCKPFYIVISDKGYMYDTQKTASYYHDKAKGGPFRDQGTRHVLTTRRDGSIAFNLGTASWGPAQASAAA